MARVGGSLSLRDRLDALKKSDALFRTQIAQALIIVKDFAGTGNGVLDDDRMEYEYEDGRPNYQLPTSGFFPQDESTLIWLVEKFKKSAESTVTADSPSVHQQAWDLLANLIFRLPVRTVAKHIKHASLPKNLQDVMAWTLRRFHEELNADREAGQSLSIERETGQSLDAEPLSQWAYFALYRSVCHFLGCLQIKTSNFSGYESFAAEQIKAALQCSSECAASILGGSFDCVVSFVNIGFAEAPDCFRTLIDPTLFFWSVHESPKSTNGNLSEAQAFSRFSLLPTLKLVLIGFPKDKHKLNLLITESCLLPYKAHALQHSDQTEVANSLVSHLPTLETANLYTLDHWQDESLETRAQSVVEVGPSNSFENVRIWDNSGCSKQHADAMSLLFIFLVGTVVDEKAKRNSAESMWLQEAFKSLAGCLLLDFDEPQKSTLSVSGLEGLDNMLATCVSFGFSPDPTILKTVIVHFSGLSTHGWVSEWWQRVKVCTELDYKVVTDDMSGDKQAMSGSALECIVDGISKVDGSIASGTCPKGEVIAAAELLFKPLVSAFAYARKLRPFFFFWKHQLATSYSQAWGEQITGPTKTHEVFWEQQMVHDTFVSIIESFIAERPRLELLEQITSDFRLSLASGDEIRDFCAVAVALRCLLETLPTLKTGHRSSERIKLIFKTSANCVCDTAFPEVWKKTIWDLMICSCETLSEASHDDEFAQIQRRVLDKALNTVLEALSSKQDRSFYAAARSASLAMMWIPTLPFRTNTAFGSLHDLYRPVFEKAHEVCKELHTDILKGQLEASNWSDSYTSQGEAFSISSPVQFLNAWFHDFIEARCFTSLERKLGTKLLQELCAVAFLQVPKNITGWLPTRKGSNGELYWHYLWSMATSSARVAESQNLSRILYPLQIEELINPMAPFDVYNADFYRFALYGLQDLRILAISKKDRASLVNHISSKLYEGIADREIRMASLRILKRLLEHPQKEMHLVSHPTKLWDLVGRLDESQIVYLNEVELIRQIGYLVIDCCFSKGSQHANPDEVGEFTRKLESCACIPAVAGLVIASSAIVACIIRRKTEDRHFLLTVSDRVQITFWNNQFRYLSMNVSEDASNIQHLDPRENLLPAFDNLAHSLYAITPKGEQRQTVLGSFKTLERAIIGFAQRLHGNLEPSPNQEVLDVWAQCLVSLRKIISHLSNGVAGYTNVDLLQGKELEYLSIQPAKDRILDIVKSFGKLRPHDKATLLLRFLDPNNMLLSYPGGALLLSELVGVNIPQQEQERYLKLAFKRVFTAMRRSVLDEEAPQVIPAKLKILDRTLSGNPWVFDQKLIEESLPFISILTSAISPEGAGEADAIYNRLLDLLRTILTFHRVRLGGRYHILIPTLKGLLRCLVVPYEFTMNREIEIPQPHWLPRSSNLGEREAGVLARIISTICDPTPSAAAATNRRGSGPTLNDETKRAKALAGDHMQYVLMEYCALMLRGRLLPGARKALMPGLYAIFDAMDANVAGALYEMMDDQGRDVYRALRKEWVRFGKWEGN